MTKQPQSNFIVDTVTGELVVRPGREATIENALRSAAHRIAAHVALGEYFTKVTWDGAKLDPVLAGLLDLWREGRE